MGKTGNGMMKQSEESITRITFYRFPHHDSRSFNHALDDDFPSAVILNGGKNALWEKRETE